MEETIRASGSENLFSTSWESLPPEEALGASFLPSLSPEIKSIFYKAGAAPGWAALGGAVTLPYLLTLPAFGSTPRSIGSKILSSRPAAVATALMGALLFSVGYAALFRDQIDEKEGGLKALALNLAIPLMLGLYLAGPAGLLRTRPSDYLHFITKSWRETFKNDWTALLGKAGVIFNPQWYIHPFTSGPNPVAMTGLRRVAYSTIRTGGVVGLGINLYHDHLAETTLKENVAWQRTRMIFGLLMVGGIVEYTVSTMALLRLGAYINAGTEVIVELANQRKTTAVADLNYFRFSLGVLRTGVFSMALDRGIYFTRLRRLSTLNERQFLARYPAEAVAGKGEKLRLVYDRMKEVYATDLSWEQRFERLNTALGNGLRERILTLRELSNLETRSQRISIALEAVLFTSLLMAPVYTAEGILQGVNPGNYLTARFHQVISPSPVMQITAEYFGDYTKVKSIIINKFLLFWIFGNGTYVTDPKYAGEDNAIRTLIKTRKEADRIDALQGEEWREMISFYLRKKLGHVEGDLTSFKGWLGYLRACKYSLSNDAQSFGVFFGSILEKSEMILAGGLRLLDKGFDAIAQSIHQLTDRLTSDAQPYSGSLWLPLNRFASWLEGCLDDPEKMIPFSEMAHAMYRFADTLFTPDHDVFYTLFDTLRSPDEHGLSIEERDGLVELLASYASKSPLHDKKAADWLRKTDPNRYWEEWALLRTLALFPLISKEYPVFRPLRENEKLRGLENEVRGRYLIGTSDLPPNRRLEEAIRRITNEAIHRRYGG